MRTFDIVLISSNCGQNELIVTTMDITKLLLKDPQKVTFTKQLNVISEIATLWVVSYEGKEYVVKKFINDNVGDGIHELKIMASLTHRNIIKAEKYWFNDKGEKLICIMMESFPFSAASFHKIHPYQLMHGVLSALYYLHSREPPMLHRDVKPANILMRADGTCVLADLDVTRILADEMTARTGTGGFRDPKARGTEYGLYVDIFSFGKTMEQVKANCTLDSEQGAVLDEVIQLCAKPSDVRPSAGELLAFVKTKENVFPAKNEEDIWRDLRGKEENATKEKKKKATSAEGGKKKTSSAEGGKKKASSTEGSEKKKVKKEKGQTKATKKKRERSDDDLNTVVLKQKLESTVRPKKQKIAIENPEKDIKQNMSVPNDIVPLLALKTNELLQKLKENGVTVPTKYNKKALLRVIAGYVLTENIKSHLSTFSKDALKELCEKFGTIKSGNKDFLVDKIVEFLNSHFNKPMNVDVHVMPWLKDIVLSQEGR